MFFVIAKTLGVLLLPSNLALLLIGLGGVGLLTRLSWLRRTAIGCLIGGMAILLVGGLSPIGDIALTRLEQRHASLTIADVAKSAPPKGLIILGGFEDSGPGRNYGQLATNSAGERLLEGARLARALPSLKVVFTGAVVRGLAVEGSQAAGVAQFLIDMGIERERIILEPAARNTFENAVKLKQVLANLKTRDATPSDVTANDNSGARGVPAADADWLLVTSAYHMPRAMAVFESAGFHVRAFPVDQRTPFEGQELRWPTRASAGLARFDTAVREYFGLLAYWLSGRISGSFGGRDGAPESTG